MSTEPSIPQTGTSSPSTTSSPTVATKKESKIRVEDVKETSDPPKTILPGSTPFIMDILALQLDTTPKTGDPTRHSSSAATTVRYPVLQATLLSAYREKSELMMPLSGLSESSKLSKQARSFPIQAVSLTINAKNLHAIKERELIAQTNTDEKKTEKKDKKSEQRLSLQFGQAQLEREAAWHRIEKPIAIEDIFKSTDELKGKKNIQRVLIEGRAGVGKTTLVQFVAWQWAEHGLFNSEYDYLLWVPLRKWLIGNSNVSTTFAEDLAAFLHPRFFPTETTTARLVELEAILSTESSRTLLVLDGYDEVAHHLDRPDSVYGQLLRQALQFKQVIVTTRDYQPPPADISFGNTFINIGFTDAQIEQYVTDYSTWRGSSHTLDSKYTNSKPDPSSSLIQALRSNPRLWALAHIPLNLALICETQWRRMLTTSPQTTVLNDLTLTALYEEVMKCFLLQQLHKQDQMPKLYDMDTLKREFIIEWDSLSTLAWEGFQKGEVVLSIATQKRLLMTLRQRYDTQKKLELFLERAYNLGLLRSENPENPNLLEQPRYFIHLTFQEYLTAYYVVDTLQGYRGETLYHETLTWITQHKYDPHAAVVIGFIAGISIQPGYEQALASFWHTLLSPPHDLTGLAHLRLMPRCLEEARCDPAIPHCAQLLKEIQQWGKSLLVRKLSGTEIFNGFWRLHQYPHVWKQTHLMDMLITAAGDFELRFLAFGAFQSMGGELARLPKALATVLKTVGDKGAWVEARQSAIRALSSMGTELSRQPEALAALLEIVGDKGDDVEVRAEAVRALGSMSAEFSNQPEALAAVLKVVGDKGDNAGVRAAAVSALGSMGTELSRQPQASAALLKALGDKSDHVRVRMAVVRALSSMDAELSRQPEALAALLKAVGDKGDDAGVRAEAVRALGCMGIELSRQPEALAALLKVVGDKSDDVWLRRDAVQALSGMDAELSRRPEALATVVKIADDKSDDFRVRQVAVWALNKIAALLKAIGDKSGNVGAVAVSALGSMIGAELAGHPEALLAVFKAIDEGWKANQILQAYWALYIQSAIHHYLSTENSYSTLGGWLMKPWGGNPWLGGILRAVSLGCIPFSASLILDKHTLQIRLGSEKETLAFTASSTLRPLIEAISSSYTQHQLILPGYTACVEGKPFYPQAKQPTFRSSVWPKPRTLPSTNPSSSTMTRSESGMQITLVADSTSNRSQQLKKQLKPVPSQSLQTSGNTSLPTLPVETELRQQLLFSQQRQLLDAFLINVQKMVQRTAALYVSADQRLTITEPQVFLSYAWEAESTRLKRLQEMFLRDTLAKDLRRVGLNPWLDIERMVGDMDGQMRDNVHNSQFVILIGTQRYAERTQAQKCGLLQLPAGSFKDKDSVQNLPIPYNTFYLRVDNRLFYISDKAKNQYKDIELAHENDILTFDRELNLTTTLTAPRSKQLTSEDLAKITQITHHECRTNVRKEFEFTLEQAKKSNDFLLPLLLEGEWGTTFPEISKYYLVFDSRTWFSLGQGWLFFEQYIHGLTQLSPLGILPAVLGMSRLNDYPEYRKALREEYETLYRNLVLELQRLTPSIENKPSMGSSSSSVSMNTSSSNNSHSSTSSSSSSSQNRLIDITKPLISLHIESTKPHVDSKDDKKNQSFLFASTTHTSSLFSSKSNPPPQTLLSLKETLETLCKKRGYRFTCTRLQNNQLQLAFTSFESVSVFSDANNIQKQLTDLTKSLQQFMVENGFPRNDFKFIPDFEHWTLTIEAQPSFIDEVNQLLQTAGLVSKAQTEAETCRLQ